MAKYGSQDLGLRFRVHLLTRIGAEPRKLTLFHVIWGLRKTLGTGDEPMPNARSQVVAGEVLNFPTGFGIEPRELTLFHII